MCVFASLRYLVDEPLAEGGRDPLPGVDAAVHEDGGLGAAALLTELIGQKVAIIVYFFSFFYFQRWQRQMLASYLEEGHGASLVRASDHLLADQT